MNWWKHFRTITYHKYLVMKGCFAVGLYWQGICHDLSKYSPAEFWVGAKYYQGNRSPNNAEREELGYSGAWLHHKGRNKHHYEYWMDYCINQPDRIMAPFRMPERYVIEMFMDRIAASKVYNKEKYTDSSPLQYYQGSLEKAPDFLHEDTRKELEQLLSMLAESGETETFRYIRKEILKKSV
ncbi:MAG: catalase [Clostridiales bacterium]|nr:catalase [Clostridiales bacterium]